MSNRLPLLCRAAVFAFLVSAPASSAPCASGLDEVELALPPDLPAAPQVAALAIDDPLGVLRVRPSAGAVIVAGDAPPPPGLDEAWLAGREARDGAPTAYVCRGVTCSLPITEPGELAPLEAPPA